MDFPRLPVEPGRYAAEWFIDDRTVDGEIELASAQPPRLTFFGEAKPLRWETDGRTRRAGFPQDHELPQIVGKLRLGHDVLVTDAEVSVWFPQRTTGFGRHAVVGLGLANVTDARYSKVRLQITAADLLFGVAPIKSTSFPDPASFEFKGQFGAELNQESFQRWDDQSSNPSVTCSYEGNFSLANRYRHQLTFAPIVELEGDAATVDEWMSRWVRPLLGLTALSTRGPQHISWLTVHASSEIHHSRGAERTGVLFGSGIYQEPYQAEYPEEWRDPERRPLFTLKDLPIGLPSVLRLWQELEASGNPFLELYRSVLFQPQLPPRARFLYMVQALEGLHSYEHQDEDRRAQSQFELRREAVLAEIATAGLSAEARRFVSKEWSRRRTDSLDRRLRSLLASMPEDLRDRLVSQALPLAAELERDGERRLEAQIRRLRNDLSHGSRPVDEGDLAPWVRVLETVAQGHLLRLLGFDWRRIGELLVAR